MMTVPDEGTFAVRAEPAAAAEAKTATGPFAQGPRWLLPAGILLLAGVLAVYLADLVRTWVTWPPCVTWWCTGTAG